MSKIFCVEDDANIRELVLYTLNATGFEGKGFESADSFFDSLKTENSRFGSFGYNASRYRRYGNP